MSERRPRILLTSVFGPYAQDDEYGSRAINPMELYHNQVTRVQGAFSLRMFHRSWGLMLIQANIEAPCIVLDFPTRDRFIEEIRRMPYDVVGISAIRPNVAKVEADVRADPPAPAGRHDRRRRAHRQRPRLSGTHRRRPRRARRGRPLVPPLPRRGRERARSATR